MTQKPIFFSLFFAVFLALFAQAKGAGTSAIKSPFTLVGHLETRNYTHLSYALAAFSRQASLDYDFENIRPVASHLLYTPALAGIDLNQLLKVYFFKETSPQTETNTFHRLVFSRLNDNGAQLFDAMRTIYTAFERHKWGVTFSQPRASFDWPFEAVTVSLDKETAIISESAMLIEWYTLTTPLLPSSTSYDGVFAGNFNAAAMSQLLTPVQTSTPTTLTGNNLTQLLSGLIAVSLPTVEKIVFATETDGIALSLKATITPKTNHKLHHNRHNKALSLPQATIIPENAIFAAVDACPSTLGDWISNIFDRQVAGMPTLNTIVTKNITSYTSFLAPTANNDSLLFVSSLVSLYPSQALNIVTQTLATASFGKDLTYHTQPLRRENGVEIHSYQLVYHKTDTDHTTQRQHHATIDANTLPLLIALATKGLTCEVALSGSNLALTLGPPGSITDVLKSLENATANPQHLQHLAATGNYRLPPTAESISLFYPVRLFHNLVKVLPGSRTEMVRRIPTTGDGFIAVRLPPDKNGDTASHVRFAANELNSLQTAISRGQPIIQELLLMSAFQSLMEIGK